MNEAPSLPAPEMPEQIRIGAFFLETLTTGMYENAFDCVREYVQNGFDAVNDAIAGGLISEGDGRITVSIGGSTKQPNLSIKDNGTGASRAIAVDRFVSLGASMKQPVHHAGFRGIGRLAGMAYCNTLRFTTKAANEEAATVIEFDCGLIRAFMSPGADAKEVNEVIRASLTISSTPHRANDHFTEVELIGLYGLGLEFVEQEKLTSYLAQTSPVEYSESFSFAERIREIASGFGTKIPVVEVELKIRKDRFPIRKPYKNSFPTTQANAKSTLTDIESLSSKEHGWVGWFGISNFPGEITDEGVAGVRFRMKNIQIGDEAVVEDIAARLTAGGTDRRLQRWAVGEIFVTNTEVVPNARRDGFEDNAAWRNIQADIESSVAKRVVKLIRDASKIRNKIKKVRGAIQTNTTHLASTKVTRSAAGEVDKDLRRQLAVLEGATSKGADPKEVSELIAQIKQLRETLEQAKIVDDPTPPKPPRPVLDVVREVLKKHLNASKVAQIMKEIRKALNQ